MDHGQVRRVRSFNRLVIRSVGALDDSYLKRGRPLGEARLIFEVGSEGADARALRNRLGLDSGYLSRLLRSLESQRLIEVRADADDRRRRRVTLTRAGRAELAAYDRLSDKLAASMLEGLEVGQRDRLVAAMGEVEQLLRAAGVDVTFAEPTSADARSCLDEYFRELAARFESGFDPGGDTSADEDLIPPMGFFVVARLDGEPVGCGGLERIDRETGEIKRVWTAPSARGLGIARRILRKLEGAAQGEGIEALRLDTNRALKEAHALYRKEGYREIARYNDNPYAHHWFEKRPWSSQNVFNAARCYCCHL
jgi:DNA-binding MarR family transcriptional regulator/GNAT superfamily N-acetyltransferase